MEETKKNIQEAHELYSKAHKAISLDKDTEKGVALCEGCLKLEPNHKLANFEFFAWYVIGKRYEKAFDYLRKLYSISQGRETQELNTYLYILNYYFSLPDDLKNIVQNIQEAEIMIYSYEIGADCLASLRKKIISYNFYGAKNILKSITESHNDTKYILLLVLTARAHLKKREMNKYVTQLVESDDLEKISEFLVQIETQRKLSFKESVLFSLLKDLLEMRETRQIPIIKDDSFTAFDAILNKDFRFALSQKAYFINDKCKKEPILMLLLQIVELMDEIELESKTALDKFKDILNYLKEGKEKQASTYLHSFLVQIEKSEYESFLQGIIKICIQEGTIFYDFVTALLGVIRGKVNFDVFQFIERMKNVARAGDGELAKMYFQVISDSKLLDESTLEDLRKSIDEESNLERVLDDGCVKSLDECYGINGVQAIVDAIESGLKIQDAFNALCATEEQRSIVLLIFAKECFTQGNVKMGNKYLKQVERSKKTTPVKRLFALVQKIRNNPSLRSENRTKPYIIVPLEQKNNQ